MKRSTKKLVLPLLLSGILIGTNVCYVCAQGQVSDLTEGGAIQVNETTAPADTSAQTTPATQPETGTQTGDTTQSSPVTPPETATPPGDTTQSGNTDQAGDAAQPGDTTQSGNTDQAGDTAQPGDTTQSGNTDQAGDTTQSGGTDQTEDMTQSGDTAETPENGGDGTTSNDSEQDAANPDETEEGEIPDDAAAADGTVEEPFVNQNGEEILPSTLVGVDYNTVSDIYDGAGNVIKQYVISDTYAKDTIISCTVDENGNLVMVISQGSTESEETEDAALLGTVEEKLSSVFGSSSSAPAVDGSFSGWDDVPASYEFNWNKPDAWVDGVHYTDTNSTDVRHEMKIYSDGENVYLRVVFAREFSNGQVANGNDYQFWIDNQQMAAYQVEWPDGTSLSNSSAQPGVYQVDVRHRDSSWSYVLTDGAVAYYRVNDGNLNNELELKIPLSEFVKQNGNINLDNYSMISFFTPNLMQDKISTAGASSGAEPFAAAAFLLIPTSYICLKKKDKKEMALA